MSRLAFLVALAACVSQPAPRAPAAPDTLAGLSDHDLADQLHRHIAELPAPAADHAVTIARVEVVVREHRELERRILARQNAPAQPHAIRCAALPLGC